VRSATIQDIYAKITGSVWKSEAARARRVQALQHWLLYLSFQLARSAAVLYCL
jgi:hypothetical protein